MFSRLDREISQADILEVQSFSVHPKSASDVRHWVASRLEAMAAGGEQYAKIAPLVAQILSDRRDDIELFDTEAASNAIQASSIAPKRLHEVDELELERAALAESSIATKSVGLPVLEGAINIDTLNFDTLEAQLTRPEPALPENSSEVFFEGIAVSLKHGEVIIFSGDRYKMKKKTERRTFSKKRRTAPEDQHGRGGEVMVTMADEVKVLRGKHGRGFNRVRHEAGDASIEKLVAGIFKASPKKRHHVFPQAITAAFTHRGHEFKLPRHHRRPVHA